MFLKLTQKLLWKKIIYDKIYKVKPFVSIYTTLLERYNLIPSESVFIDDNQNNITTGNSLGIISKKVELDNYDSVVNIINELNLM